MENIFELMMEGPGPEGVLVLAVLVMLVSIAVAKISLYRTERLRQLSDACTHVTDENKKKDLEEELYAALKDTFERFNTSFVDYYRGDVSRAGQTLYVVGAVVLLFTISFTFVLTLLYEVLPWVKGLAADTVIAGQYGASHAVMDAGNNLSLVVIAAVLFFTSAIWLFSYTGQRARVVFRILLSKEEIAHPVQVKWSHVIFVSIGFVLPVAFCTYIVYLVICGVQLDNIRVAEIIQAEYTPTGDDVQEKLEAGRLIKHYESICDVSEDSEVLERVWSQIEVRESDDVKSLVRGMTTTTCLREKLSEGDLRDLLRQLNSLDEEFNLLRQLESSDEREPTA